MPAIKHIHTYVRYKAKPNWYRCAAPNCTHHIDKEVLLGKYSLCTSCGQEMILSREDLRRAKPRCLNCSKTKKAKIFQKAQELTQYLGTADFDPLKLKIATDQGSLFNQVQTQTQVVELEEEELEIFNTEDEDGEEYDPEEEDDFDFEEGPEENEEASDK